MNRIEYIDLAKGVGIILVVIGHSISGIGYKFIYSFHMPLFFFLSGMCFSIEKYPYFASFLAKRAKQILVPCFFFTSISLLLGISLLHYDIKDLWSGRSVYRVLYGSFQLYFYVKLAIMYISRFRKITNFH